MPKGILLRLFQIQVKMSKNQKLPDPCFALSIIKVRATILLLMRQRGCFTSTSVHFVLP